MINIENLTYRVQGRVLLDSINLSLMSAKCAALVGRNGAGKSTLFQLILSKLFSDSGEIKVPKNCKIAGIAQDIPSGDISIRDFVIKSDERLYNLLQKLNSSDCDDISLVCEELEAINGFAAEAKAAEVLKGLGFEEEKQVMKIDDFSGGFRARVALAAAIFLEPDLLLLDEPTNHLDLESVIWLKKFIKNYPKKIIIISHDRDMLNDVVDEVLHIHNSKLYRYKGNFDQFLSAFEERNKNAQKYNKKIEATKSSLEQFINRFKAKASKAKQAQSKMKALLKLKTVEVLEEAGSVQFEFKSVDRAGSNLIRFNKLSLGYDENIVLSKITGGIDFDDRIALLGVNGSGKSTFAKFLDGRLLGIDGDSFRVSGLKVGYFHQYQTEELDLDLTPLELFQVLMPKALPMEVRGYLGRFGFSSNRVEIKIANFSGGEKVRLVFAKLCLDEFHLLVLDEPTNHLDIQARESLIIAINNFKGAVIIISHDFHLLRHTAERYLLIKNSKLENFDGDIEDYTKIVLK